MKVLIWLVCIFVFSLVQVTAQSQGVVLGGVPTVLLALLLVFLPATLLCKLWSKRTQRPAIPKDRHAERWYTCPKCGQLVREGETCDCEMAQQVQRDKLCGTPFIRERQRLDAELAAGNITQEEHSERVSAMDASAPPPPDGPIYEPPAEQPQKKSRTIVALSVLCAVLAVCSCILCYKVHEYRTLAVSFIEENDRLLSENKDLEAEVEALQAPIEPSFSSWVDWNKLYEAGYIKLSYDEWLAVIGS